MEFLNIGGGEILVIILLALILFGPEDIMKIMRTLGKYTRSARDYWNQFNTTLQQEYAASEELSQAKEVVESIKSSVGEITTSVTTDIAAAQKAITKETREGAAAVETATRAAAQAAAGQDASPAPKPKPAPPKVAAVPVEEPQAPADPNTEPQTHEPAPEVEDPGSLILLGSPGEAAPDANAAVPDADPLDTTQTEPVVEVAAEAETTAQAVDLSSPPDIEPDNEQDDGPPAPATLNTNVSLETTGDSSLPALADAPEVSTNGNDVGDDGAGVLSVETTTGAESTGDGDDPGTLLDKTDVVTEPVTMDTPSPGIEEA